MSPPPRRAASAAALVLALFACSPPGPPPPPDELVVVIVIDTLCADGLSSYGCEHPTSPHIDALAADGVRFERAYSVSGWTLPSVASLLTGAWPQMHKALGKGALLSPISADLPTAPELLQEAGFRTVGFANATFVNPLQGMSRGFDVFDHYPAFNDRIRRAKETIEEALGEISKHGGQDTFCFIHLFDPHLNYDPPPGYRGTFSEGLEGGRVPISIQSLSQDVCGGKFPRDCIPTPEQIAWIRAVYHEEIRFVDEQIGTLVSELKKADLYDRATIVITADHGEEFWEHESFEHGHTLYEELVHVPLIVKFPSSYTPARSTVSTRVRVLDTMPTLFDRLGLEAPESFVGESLLPVIAGEDEEDRTCWLEGTLYGIDMYALIKGDLKYIRDVSEGGGEELYDLAQDPGETNNLMGARRAESRTMSAAFDAFFAGLRSRSQAYRPGEAQDMSPQQRSEFEQQADDLGYGGTRGGGRKKDAPKDADDNEDDGR